MNNNDNHNQNENNDGIGQQPRLLPRDDEDETQETDAENHLYELMGAADMTSATSLHSNLGENFPNPLGNLEFNGNEDQWRSTADILRDAQELDAAEVYQDVYRSVAAIDMNTQNRMGLEGTRFLDKEDTQSHYDASLQLQQQQQVQPQLKPRIFDRIRLEHTHFYVSCPLTKFIDEMGIQFKVLKVDYMFDPQICVWRGMFFPAEPNEAVDFRVHMNSTKQDVVSPNNQLVEFVRRSGCTLAFNQLFARIRLALVDQKLVTKPDGTIVASVLDLPPAYEEVEKLKQQLKSPSNNSNSSSSSSNNGQQLDGDLLPKPLLLSRSSSANSSVDDFDEDDDDDSMLGDIQCTDQELFHPLFNMAKSAFQDVHVQGLALIAREAKRGNGARMNNACNGLIELLIERLVSSSHPEVKRNCCTSLCEMARDQSLHDELLDKGAPAVLANVAATTYNPATLETQRQAAFALSNLCDNADALKAVFQAVESKIAVFEELAKCDDTRLTQAITNVRSALEAC